MRSTIFAVLFSLILSGVSHGEVIVAVGSTWKWLHPTGGIDPKVTDEDFHKTFMNKDFDDKNWKSGKDSKGPTGGFGYGDEDVKGVDLVQPENPMHRKTAYFRIKFKTDKKLEMLKLKCQRDDSLIAYIDGKEVTRDNLPVGAKDAFDLHASTTISGQGEKAVNTFPFKVALAPGEHVLAISLHNRAGGSSDLRLAEISLETASEDDFADSEDEDDLF